MLFDNGNKNSHASEPLRFFERILKGKKNPAAPLAAILTIAALAWGLLFYPSRVEARRPSAARTPTAPASPAGAEDLGALIDGLQTKYSRMRGLAADFVQIYQGQDGRTLRESGRLLLKRPGKARWDYTEPERKLFVSDGKNIYFYVFGERQATKASVKESVDPQIPFLFLLGRGNLRRDFKRIELLSDEKAVGAGNRVLRLVPQRAPEQFKRLLVEVNPSSFEVRRMVIFERGGARMDFTLNNVRENYIAPDSEFQFAPPSGVMVREQK